jgi:hypothetical protein
MVAGRVAKALHGCWIRQKDLAIGLLEALSRELEEENE